MRGTTIHEETEEQKEQFTNPESQSVYHTAQMNPEEGSPHFQEYEEQKESKVISPQEALDYWKAVNTNVHKRVEEELSTVQQAKGKIPKTTTQADKGYYTINNTLMYMNQLLDEDAFLSKDKTTVDKTYYKIPIVWKNIPETTDTEGKSITKRVELEEI